MDPSMLDSSIEAFQSFTTSKDSSRRWTISQYSTAIQIISNEASLTENINGFGYLLAQSLLEDICLLPIEVTAVG